MYVLGIESTCDETAAAIVEDGRKVISNVISTSVKEQALYGGVVPEIASRRHAEYISATVDKALADANMTMKDVDAVAVTFAPGRRRISSNWPWCMCGSACAMKNCRPACCCKYTMN